MESPILTVKNFNAFFGETKVLSDIKLSVTKNKILALMGPSGCGKTTFLRCINRLHELTPGARAKGSMILQDEDIYKMNLIKLRKKVGMVFQHPNPFPTMSIFDNVISGFLLNGLKLSRSQKEEIVQGSLAKAGLWKEVKDRLHKRGTFLSGGQQQRLCIARSIAMKPDILLLDEPTASLDPASTKKIEELMMELKKDYTILIVTHNIQQASRISDMSAFFYLGELIEYNDTKTIFNKPENKITQNYIDGKFG